MTIDLSYCEGQTAARMRAPDGFVWYKWTRSGQPDWKIEGQGRQYQNIVVPDPVDGEEFICEVKSELGDNCAAKLRTIIDKTSIDADFAYGIMEDGGVPLAKYNYENRYDTCNRTATFVDLSSVRNSKKETILWEIIGLEENVISSDSLFTFTFPDPETNKPDTYLIRLTVSAENGCVDTSKARANHHITIYPSPRVEIAGDDQICAGDSAYLEAIAVRSTFVGHVWEWDDTADVRQMSTGDSLVIHAPGTYFITSLDSAGCIAKDTLVVTTLRPQMDTTLHHVDCYGEATGWFFHGPITGGQTPYISFQWILLDANGNTYTDPGQIGGNTYMNLIAGTYVFEAIDAKNCALRGEIVIKQNDSLQINAVHYATTCGMDNGKLKLNAQGGVPPYEFAIYDEDGNLITSSDTASNLSSGQYRITVTDNLGCLMSNIVSVPATPIPYIEVVANIQETCEQSNGSLWVRPEDAVFPVSFSWNTGRPEDTTNMISYIKSGTYTVTMVDKNGCQVDLELFVESYPTPVVSVAKTPETCHRADGTITLTVDCKYPDYLVYKWEDNIDTSAILTGLKAGTYQITVADDTCSVDFTVEIEHIDAPIADFESNSYNVASNTIFTLTDVSQGAVKICRWDMGDGNTQTGKSVYYTYAISGDYVVFLEVEDENGCTDTISKSIHVYEELNVYLPNMFTPNGDKINDVWKPEMSEYTKEGYQLSIFDRWGQRIFHTTDPEEAWDGTIDGKFSAPNTVYSFRVTVQDFTGNEHEFVGQITIVR
jgi:gliding motility-associated-like protein